MVRGREELADFAPERLAQEPLEGDAFHVFAGVGKVVAFQQPDDFAARGRFQVQSARARRRCDLRDRRPSSGGKALATGFRQAVNPANRP